LDPYTVKKSKSSTPESFQSRSPLVKTRFCGAPGARLSFE
jgi:hypothetical protein